MEEANAAKKVGVIGITLNLLLLTIKFTIGMLFRSQGILADAVNSFGDVFSSIVTYVGGKISSRPRDEDHEFGHGKAEFVASFLIGIFMTIVSINMLYKSILAIINNNKFEISYLVVLVPLITIVIKLIMYIVVTRIGEKNNSLLISANARDHRNDVIISIGVLIGIAFGFLGYYFVDALVGMAISIIIIITGIKITYEAYDVLIDKCIDTNISKEIKEDIESIEGIRHVDSILSKPTGNLYMLMIKISVNPEMTVKESHKIAAKIRYELIRKEGVYDAVVHVNPDE